ncbi:MAG: TRAP transporter small permease [Deltaproteobacteria bacterium]|nr:TRAP transporter small permease [Deltaproteobacteria bacterium]
MENLARWLNKINIFFSFIAAAAIAMMMISTTLDTTSRYVFNYPIAGVFEFNEVLLVIAVFMTLSWTQEARGHTRVVLGLRRFSIRSAIKLDTLCWVLCFIFLAVMGWQSAREALRSYEINEFRWGSVQMQIWWAKALVPLGCWLTCLQLVVDIWVNFRRLMGALPLDLPDLRQIGD